MKKIITLICTIAIAIVLDGCSLSAQISRKDVLLNLNDIHTDAALKQFKKASKSNQYEVLTELVNQANKKYVECETIEQVYDLRERVSLLNRYVASAKQSFMSVQHSINTLNTKINKTIRAHEGGAVVTIDGAGGYYDFGQELK